MDNRTKLKQKLLQKKMDRTRIKTKEIMREKYIKKQEEQNKEAEKIIDIDNDLPDLEDY